MSPELIDPQRFGLEDSRPTTASDCYALGMVIYESISGHLPFHKHPDIIVFMKVSRGERPPRGTWFTDSLWEILELCWEPQPRARPTIEDILQYLEGTSQSFELPSLGINGEVDRGSEWDSESDSFGMFLTDPLCSVSYSQHILSTCHLLPTHKIRTQCTRQRSAQPPPKLNYSHIL